MPHEYDEDAICLHCGFDGAEAHCLRQALKAEIGAEEFRYRWEAGDFDHERYCPGH